MGRGLERNLRLHLGAAAADDPAAARLLGEPRTPTAATRRAQRLRLKFDHRYWWRAWHEPLVALRRRVLGGHAPGPPRFLVRVDEFPDAATVDRPGDLVPQAERFHQVFLEAGVPYLLAVLPEPATDPFDPRGSDVRPLSGPERELIARVAADGVALAQHGTTHRTRWRSPRRHSELVGLSPARTGELIDRGSRALQALRIDTPVFVPPFNRFSASQWPVLAERFEVVCGGPESTLHVGFHGGPLWWGDAVYLPSYQPLYGLADEVLAAARELIRVQPGTWIPIALHLTWEVATEFVPLRRLLAEIAPYAVAWDDFLAEVKASRG